MEESREKLAHAFSIVLHPSAVALYLFFGASLGIRGSLAERTLWTLLPTFFASAVPGLVVLGFLKKGYLSDADITNRAERVKPYILITILYSLGCILLLTLKFPKPIVTLMACYATVTACGTIITLFWKISMHLAGLAGPITGAIYFWGLKAVPFSAAIIPLVWARLSLRRHNLWQVLGGIFMSSLVTYLTCLWFTAP